MALTATALVEAQIRAKEYWGTFENRLSNFGALKAFLDNGPRLLPKDALEAIKNASNARDVSFPILTKQNISVITSRSCTINGVEAVSAKPLASYITRGFEIKVYPKVSDNNNISEVDQFAQGLRDGLRSAGKNLDTYAANQLEAGKSTSLVPVNLDGVNIVGNAYQIDYAKRDRLYFYLPTILEKNDMNTGEMNNIATTESMELMLQYESMGASNQQNLNAVLNGNLPDAAGFRHYRSNRLTNGANVSETHYEIPFGGIGVFIFNDSDAINKRTGANGQHAYLMTDPILGIRWDVAEEPICSDLTGTYGAGYERTYGTKYQFAASFVWINAYSSDSSKANIKVEVLQNV